MQPVESPGKRRLDARRWIFLTLPGTLERPSGRRSCDIHPCLRMRIGHDRGNSRAVNSQGGFVSGCPTRPIWRERAGPTVPTAFAALMPMPRYSFSIMNRLATRFSTDSSCRFPLLLILVIAALAAVSPPARAQTVSGGEHKNVNPALDPTPVNIEALNLHFNPPRGANTVAENVNGKLVVRLSDDPKSPNWTMSVQAMTSTLPKPSPQAEIDDLLKELEGLKAQGARFTVLVNEPRTAGGLQGQLCYLQRTIKDDKKNDKTYVSGWLVLPTAPAEFLVITMQTVPENFQSMKSAWEACFGTIDIRTKEQVLTERGTRLKKGYDLLKSITPDRLRALVGQQQWSRIYKPATATGAPATEVGCAVIEVTAAKRGDLNPGRDSGKYTSAERKEGVMVRVQGRYIVDANRRVFYDSIALYWLAWDQSEEAWSVRGTQRQGDAETSEAETGVRAAASSGAPRPVLSVIKRTTSTEPVTNEWEVPEVYLSQALGWIIGRLLPRDVTSPQEYAWYFYVSSNLQPKVYQRLDKWERAGDGNFTLTTFLTPDTPPYTSTYASDGTFVRRVHGDGSVTEPIALDDLRKIWKSKGLPVSAADK